MLCTSLLLVTLLLPFNVYAEDEGFTSLHAGSIISLSAEADDMNPLYGLGIAFQKGHHRFGFDYLKGELTSEEYGAEVKNDDTLFGATYDYIFTPVTKENPIYYGLGIGYFHEEYKIEAESGPYSIDMDLSASSFSGEAILGYKAGNIDIFARLVTFPQSENVSLALMVGLGFAF